ncbi:MAG: glycylpeptide N-tetradecanoyltransferase [Amphiamblys sp. WSBS2006]|nr:MAG: glycylpeptide N-tetradecanoyltransferase [Amphiamblys sp. WSBS2006]
MFWNGQTVMQAHEEIDEHTNEEIFPLDVSKISQTPTKLPDGMEWCVIDPEDEDAVSAVHRFLAENYVEDNEGNFRFRYSYGFIRWVFGQPGAEKEWLVGIKSGGAIVGFISGFPVRVSVREKEVCMAEVDFLCLDRSMRKKGIAPLLIREMGRRVNAKGCGQAVYTVGGRITRPFTAARYYHRQISIRKLLSVGFSVLPRGSTVEEYEKMNRICVDGAGVFRRTTKADVKTIKSLLDETKDRWEVRRVFSEEEIEYVFCSDGGVVSLVSEDKDTFISFYTVSTVAIKENTEILCGYIYYYAAKRKADLLGAVRSVLSLCQEMGVDVLNCLDGMENGVFIGELGFVPGDGMLHYYLFNWKLGYTPSEKVFLSLL